LIQRQILRAIGLNGSIGAYFYTNQSLSTGDKKEGIQSFLVDAANDDCPSE
jgi:hypothetical protein